MAAQQIKRKVNFLKIKWYIYTVFHRYKFGRVGKNSYIAKTVFLLNGKSVFFGDRVRVFPNCRFETHNSGEIHINDNCSIGQNVHIISAEKSLIIGESTTLSANIFISNCDHDYSKRDQSILESELQVRPTSVGKYCFIGFGSVLLPGTILGDNCVVGANAVVKGIYPPYSMIAGNPARIIKTFNPKTREWETPERSKKT